MATVLIVDDHLDLCRLMELVVRHLGHAAECVTDAAAAVTHLGSRVPDLVVLDLVMDWSPGGIELLRWMRAGQATRELPVLIYTAHDQDDLRERVAAMGVSGYLVKNAARFDQVEATVKRILAENERTGAAVGWPA